ncbi:hypothetical protein [Cetobacterium sp.]|uniref:hypothetical protein n=1 Tax=Cetobacterium sp. TaxID=2071632 RepID=UPI003F377043
MKKLLMIAAIVAAGTAAYANTTVPVAVSLEVTKTSNLVLMDGATQLTQIDLVHKPIILAGLTGVTTNSTTSKTFTAQTGDKTTAIGGGTNGATLAYELVGAAGGSLALNNGTNTLASTLTLDKTTEEIAANGTQGTANTITSTILAADLQALGAKTSGVEGTYTGTAQLKVTATAKTTK